MGRFKIWEILLCIAVMLLSAIAYEAHKTNSQSRYVMVGNPWELLDTHTGDFWTRKYPINAIIDVDGEDTSYVYQWKLFTRGPAYAKPDTVLKVNY